MKKPPLHPAMAARPKVAQPHPATLGRPKAAQPLPPHPATVAQPKAAQPLPPHPATVAQPRRPFGGAPARPPCPAAVAKHHSVQRTRVSPAHGSATAPPAGTAQPLGKIWNALSAGGEWVLDQTLGRLVRWGLDGGEDEYGDPIFPGSHEIYNLEAREAERANWKYYIIPIDDRDRAYLGRKSRLNPYNGHPYTWGAGAPNVFGGNWQETLDETLYLETREESHHKVDLVQLNLGDKVLLHRAATQDGTPMLFYAIRGNFTYDPDPYFPNILASMPRYRECTGDVLRVDLSRMPYASANASNQHVLAEFTRQFGSPATWVAMNDFYASEAMIALRNAAKAVQGHEI